MARYIDADLLMPNAEHKGRYDVVSAYDIANTPTADVRENVRGEWITHMGYSECSVCHIKSVNESKYCPCCGAELRS